MRKPLKYVLLAACCALMTSCYYDNGEALGELIDTGCDPEQVSYLQDVLPILETHCLACHDQSNQTAGVNLEGYDNVKAYADTGTLLSVVNFEAGFPAMPPGINQIPECEIAHISVWIQEGTLNN